MPNLDYSYMPMYGIEPYKDNDGLGGATVTKNNLIVTAWELTEKLLVAPNYVDFGTILKPAAVNDSLAPTDRDAGRQAFNSRHSALAYFNGNTGGQDPVIENVGMVLNPPPEMKQQLQGALSYNGDNPLLLSSYAVNKPLQCSYAWMLSNFYAPAHNLILLSGSGALFSTYLFFSEPTADPASRLPFLKTNGSNGVAPTFFDVTTPVGVQEMIEAVNDGDFYILYATQVQAEEGPEEPPDPDDPFESIGSYFGVTYPHSIARS